MNDAATSPIFFVRRPAEAVTLPARGCCARPRVAFSIFLSGVEGSVVARLAEGKQSRSTFRIRVDFLDGKGADLYDLEVDSVRAALKRNGVQRVDSVARQFFNLPEPIRHRLLYEQLPKDRQWHPQEFQDIIAIADHFKLDGRESSDLYLRAAPLVVLPGQIRFDVLFSEVGKGYLRDLGLTPEEIEVFLPRFIEPRKLERFQTFYGKNLVLISDSVAVEERTKRQYHLEHDSGGVYYPKVLRVSRRERELEVDHSLAGGYYVYPCFARSLNSAMKELAFFQRLQIARDLTQEVKRLREKGLMHSRIGVDAVYLDRSERAVLSRFDCLQRISPEMSEASDLLALGRLFELLFNQEFLAEGCRSVELKKIIDGLRIGNPQWTEDQVLVYLSSLLTFAWDSP